MMRLTALLLIIIPVCAKKRTVITADSGQPTCCNKKKVCPRGFEPISETHCYKTYDTKLEYGCIVGKYDKDRHVCVTDHVRPTCLTCPDGYELHGTVCHAPLLHCPSVPVAASIFATPQCGPEEEPDAFHGVCKFTRDHPPVVICAGEIIQINPNEPNVDQNLLCRVTIYKEKKLVCDVGQNVVEQPCELDYINKLISQDFSQQL